MIEFVKSEFQFFILCLTTLFTLINPIGIAPLLMVMTDRFPKNDKITIAKKGSITAFITLVLFALGLVGVMVYERTRIRQEKKSSD